MKKYMDKLKRNIHINKRLFVFLLVIVIIGLISGAIYMSIVDSSDKKLIFDYLGSFFTNIIDDKLDYNTSIINTLIFTIGLALIIWLLGISVIGFFIVIFILFMKSFILGFSISSIISCYGIKGLLLSLVYAFPHHIVNILVFMLISAYALMISFKLISGVVSKKQLNFKNFLNRYLVVLVVSIILLIITSFYEIFIVPKILNFVFALIK